MLSIITGRFGSGNPLVWSVLLAALSLGAAGCDKLPLLAPSQSTISLSSSSTIVQANGTAEIRATVIESSGTPVQNGTTVTFTTTLGTLSPHEARTLNGVATVQFVANGQSGEAEIRAASGAAKPADAANPGLKLKVGGGAAGRVQVTANPSRVPVGGSSTISATVSDTNGNALAGVNVAFTTDNGLISNAVATTNSSGQAQTTLTTTKDATVTATAGGGTGTSVISGTVKVTVGTLPGLTIAVATGSTQVQGSVVTFTVTVTADTTADPFRSIVVNFGDGTTSGDVGTSTTNVQHVYNSSGTFTVTATGTSPSGDTKFASTIVSISPRGVVNVAIAKDPNTAVNRNVVVTFTATVTPSTTSVQSYNWDFGDTQTFNGGNSVSHSYATSGTKTVTVTVTTTDGNTGSGQTQVIVNP